MFFGGRPTIRISVPYVRPSKTTPVKEYYVKTNTNGYLLSPDGDKIKFKS